jgi:hypothetical protein
VTDSGASRVQRPFWLHQLVEYILGVVLISQGLQQREPLILVGAGIVILVNAAVVRGPLSAFNIMSRGAHRIFDLLVVVALVAFGGQPLWGMDVTTRSILLATGVVMFMLWRLTDYRPPSLRTGPLRRARPARTARARDSERLGKAAGRAAGGMVMRWRQQHRTDSEP